MVATQGTADRPLTTLALHRSQDVAAVPELAFAAICEVEKWPNWLSFLKTARRLDAGPLRLGSEVAIRSAIPGAEEELYEVDTFLDGYILSLVGAYSVRRRFDFRIERKSDRSKLVVKLDYPSYGGVIGALVDRMTARRKLDAALADSLIHFKGLVEYSVERDEILADF
ncbi:MAG: SRPBCC family protein [Candidatus Eremiobacteraeota bacterium]|nr:SRPBCC family protein [Candidatus Eremiobacteraeota bacterium]